MYMCICIGIQSKMIRVRNISNNLNITLHFFSKAVGPDTNVYEIQYMNASTCIEKMLGRYSIFMNITYGYVPCVLSHSDQVILCRSHEILTLRKD